MTPEVITSLINLGSAGAVIVVVAYFLSFISKRDKDWQILFTALLVSKDVNMNKISENMDNFVKEFQTHDAFERAKLEEMSKLIHETSIKTQPIRNK